MVTFICATGKSGDLFGETPIAGPHPAIKRSSAPALTTARVLCRQLRHKQARPDKNRIAHLICLNLLSILRQDSQRAHAARPQLNYSATYADRWPGNPGFEARTGTHPGENRDTNAVLD